MGNSMVKPWDHLGWVVILSFCGMMDNDTLAANKHKEVYYTFNSEQETKRTMRGMYKNGKTKQKLAKMRTTTQRNTEGLK